MTTFGRCLHCGEELRHGDWVIRAEEIRKMVVDPENVPDGVVAHKDCVIHTPVPEGPADAKAGS